MALLSLPDAAARRTPPRKFDHLIPLGIGGSDADGNIWPQPLSQASDKDKLEDQLYNEMKAGTISQKDAVAMILAWKCP